MGRRLLALAAALPLAGAGAAGGELLPLRAYTAADGLAHDRVKRVVVDRDGFVWFCTLEGLSRFDGRRFVNLGTADGLPVPSTNDLLETEHGFWVATNQGAVAFFDPDASRPDFRVHSTGPDAAARVNVLARDAKGALWAGADGGLFRLENAEAVARSADAPFVRVPLGIPGRDDASVHVAALLARPDGMLVGTTSGLLFVDGRGVARRVPLAGGAPGAVYALAEDGEGRVLVGRGDGQGLEILDGGLRRVAARTAPRDLPSGVVGALLASHGRVVVGTEDGLAILDGGSVRIVGTREGLSDGAVSSLAEDRDGGIWIASPQGGVARLLSSTSRVFDERDGFGRASRLFAGPGGEACGVSAGWKVACFDGRRFASGAPRFAAEFPASSWRGYFGALCDHDGAVWLGSPNGLYRFAKVARIEDLGAAKPVALYTARDGLATDSIAALLEDRSGDVWIGSFAPAKEPLTVWRRATGRFERFGAAAGLPDFGSPAVLALDAAGSVWISYRDGTLARHRDGRFRVVSGRDGFPAAHVKGMASDGAGRLWAIADGGILLRVDAPGATEPRAVAYGRREGVTGYYLSGLVVDGAGRVVFGTGRELLRLDPATGEIGRVLPDRVLLQSEPSSAFRDRDGALWFATWRGTVRVAPVVESGTSAPPRVRISGVNVSGSAWPVAGRGASAVDLGTLAPSANVSLEFFGLGAFGQPLAFTHVLEGLSGGWSGPQEAGSVHFAQFPAGRYRFRVRAAGAFAGEGGEASVTFSVAAPVWRRPWFLGTLAVLLAAAGYGASALRTRARRRLERARARIASDLHDDLGAGLSRIGILSEVATLALQSGARPDDAIAKIRDASREVDERLAEGIWTVDPAHDTLAGLCRRLCLLAEELLEPAGIAWRVETPEDAARVPLGPERRREIYLLFKEAFTNAARHSGARHAVLSVARSRGTLTFRLADDGRGYDAQAPETTERLTGGRGRRNMRARADALGGTLRLDGGPAGTTVVLDLPERA